MAEPGEVTTSPNSTNSGPVRVICRANQSCGEQYAGSVSPPSSERALSDGETS